MQTDIIFFTGRVLLGGFLLMNAYNHLFKSNDFKGYAEMMKVPSPKLAVIASGLILLFGGYTIIAGVRVGYGIAALVLFFLPVTFTMHAFWKKEGQARQMDKIQFLKNMALLGALLMLTQIATPWPISLGN